MNRTKKILLGTVAMAGSSLMMSSLTLNGALAGDDRGRPSTADRMSMNAPQTLSPAMKRLIGEEDRGPVKRHFWWDDDHYEPYEPVEQPGLPESDDPEDFETEEFAATNILGQINAEAAYAQGAFGESVTVGVVDGVFGIDHPDLAPNIAEFIDVDESKATELTDPDDEQAAMIREQFRDEFSEQTEVDHGTQVAGVIAATRDGEGTHGVAPEASIIAVDADALDVFSVKDGSTDPDDIEKTKEKIEKAVNEAEEEFDSLPE